MNITVDDVNICEGLDAYMQSTKAVHQQHVNCLINTWISPVKT